jgi:hypothetical protein
MKKLIILFAFAMTLNNVIAQWQEITKYGPVKDFLYINENLQYIWGDTNYIVENGKDRVVSYFGFSKMHYDIYALDAAVFVPNTLIGFKRAWTGLTSDQSLKIYRTLDGGKTWDIFYNKICPDTLIYGYLMPFNSNEVLFNGEFWVLSQHSRGIFPLTHIRNNLIEFKDIYFYKDSTRYKIIPNFIDSLYAIAWAGDKYFIRTKNNCKTWEILDSNKITNLTGIEFKIRNKKFLLSVGLTYILITSDSGRTWVTADTISKFDSFKDTLFWSADFIDSITIIYLAGVKRGEKMKLLKKDLINEFKDSTLVKQSKIIDCFGEKGYIYNNYLTSDSRNFYQNENIIDHPLSENEILELPEEKNRAYFSGNDLIINLLIDENTQYNLFLFDYTGKLIYETKINNNAGNVQVNTGTVLPKGVYIISFSNKAKRYNYKLFRY